MDRDLKITQAAINFNEQILTGRRHAHIMAEIWQKHPNVKITDDMQGFVTQDGRFWNRFQAGAIAFGAGQTETRHERLISEHLWPEPVRAEAGKP